VKASRHLGVVVSDSLAAIRALINGPTRARLSWGAIHFVRKEVFRGGDGVAGAEVLVGVGVVLTGIMIWS
jgi:hypothetical protein